MGDVVRTDAANKRAKTNMERFGFDNPFSSPQIQDKIRKTNLERYGVDRPMKCSAIRSKQASSASSGKTGVEERFDILTSSNVVYTGYGARVIHSKRVVHKLGRKMTELCPDFMVFSDAECLEAQATSDVKASMRSLSSRFVIEIFGDYYHSEGVIGVPRETHEREVKDAYASAGIECLILWEKDVLGNWDEIRASVEDWIRQAVVCMNDGRIFVPITSNMDVLRSLADPNYWRGLGDSDKKSVVDVLVEAYQKMDFPSPNDHDAIEDFRRFNLWASNSGESTRPTRFGLDCCRRYVKSMAHANVKGCRSLYDIWHDEKLMRHCVEWQFSNESGRHTAKRFLDAMCFHVGFRVVSNLHPSKVVQWMRKFVHPKSGEIFLDPCAGWGGRMLAAHALGMKYVGVDANEKLVKELRGMAADLHLDAEIYHGDSSSVGMIAGVMAGRKAGVVFTSPPYFDKEWYSEDKEQSTAMYSSRELWEVGFCQSMVRNAVSELSDGGLVILNIDSDFNICCLYSQGWEVREVDVLMENARRQHTERLIFISKTGVESIFLENNDYVVCRHCGSKCQKVTEHIRKAHGMTKEQYESLYPNALTISHNAVESASESSLGKKRGAYTKHIAYRCPDGSIVGKKDAWMRTWGIQSPPKDTIVDGGLFDPWAGKVEGLDFVVCSYCKYRALNLARHLNREHGGVEKYTGQVKSSRCVERLSAGSTSAWNVRGRKDKRDASVNKTHKNHGLTKEILEQLYVKEGMSDVKIGKRYEMTGEGIAYQRKKFGIAVRDRHILKE
jgi:tRNA1(Val) A37 N6-methylase TrmN6